MSTALHNLVISVSGFHRGYSQAVVSELVKDNGGEFTPDVQANKTTHLVTTESEISKKSAKVKAAIGAGAHLVSLAWLLESIDKGAKEDESKFSLQTNDKAVVAANNAPRRSTRRAASNLSALDVQEETPAVKKQKLEDGTAGGNKRAKKVAEPESKPEESKEDKNNEQADGKEDESPKTAPAAKSKSKAKKGGKASKADAVKHEDTSEDKPVMKTIIKKGRAPVDELCPLKGSYHVYTDKNDVAWDATLNQTNIGDNNNKFYYIQLLENDTSNSYAVFLHWGRVGEKGQCLLKVSNTTLEIATAAFQKQMKGKSGQYWENRAQAIGGGKKYVYLERNYEEDEDEDYSIKKLDADFEVAPVTPPSDLSIPLQNLMQLIFNTTFMQLSMASLSYDSKKLPLGKLSKETILRGYEVLKQLGDVIANPATAINTYSEAGSTLRTILNTLSSRYYSIIPHDFGRRVPPVIDSPQALKKETELVENLVDMKISSEIMKQSNSSANKAHPCDVQYNSLGLNEATPLPHDSEEFQLLEAYVKKTHGKTHYMKLQVQEIFRVTRSIEEERWQSAGWDTLPNSNRKLLWHGSRTTNFGGILSQGLRIAPPEAPVNGYMFDKGIYLADIVSKSANYCCANSSDNTGLLLLCEAQLGDPMLELSSADYHASTKCAQQGRLATKGIGCTAPSEWEDGGVIHERLKGVQVPKVTGKESNITKDIIDSRASLQYNEYIVYDVSQVKIRYLFRCKFSY